LFYENLRIKKKLEGDVSTVSYCIRVDFSRYVRLYTQKRYSTSTRLETYIFKRIKIFKKHPASRHYMCGRVFNL